MSRTFHDGSRRIRVRGIRRTQPDLRKLGHALLYIVQAFVGWALFQMGA